jgi:TonB family protein
LSVCDVSARYYKEMTTVLLAMFLLAPQAEESDVLRIGPGMEPPKLTYKIEPRYTRTALDAGVQGNVLFALIVDEHGLPKNIVMLSPLGFGLDENAKECLSQWRFKPATKEGKPVKVYAQVEVNFRLLDTNFDTKAEMRRMQFNAIVSSLTHKDSKPSERDLTTMQDLAKHKFAPADYMIGIWELEGDVLPKDVAAGLAQIQKAADKNYGPALSFTGNSKMQGDFFPKDVSKGLSLIHEAAVLGSNQAQFTLGDKYTKGDGVDVDIERAKRYFRLCAAAGTPDCQLRLAKLLIDMPEHSEQDWLQGVAWLQLAEGHDLAAAKPVAAAETAKLTPQQAQWVVRLKAQLEHAPGLMRP